jgi:sulfate/thiosulfate transport system substrate-binding protein
MPSSMVRRVRSWCAAGALTALVVGLSGCGNAGGEDVAGNESKDGLMVSAFTSAQAGWNAVIPAFLASPAGSGVKIHPTYGASGDLADSITGGKSTDLVNFSDEPSVNDLVSAGLVAPDWNAGPGAGSPFGSVITLVVRAGNPKNIHDWADLLQPGLEVVTPNPTLSGSGKWGFLAAYAAMSKGNQVPAVGEAYLRALILEHIKNAPATGTAATDAFLGGTGDVLLTSESAAADAERKSSSVQHVTPPQTLKVDNLVAVLSGSPHVKEATALRDYLFTPEAQRLWARAGYRPSDPAVAAEFATQFPMPDKLWTIGDIGGWNAIDAKFFDSDNGLVTKVFKEAVQ